MRYFTYKLFEKKDPRKSIENIVDKGDIFLGVAKNEDLFLGEIRCGDSQRDSILLLSDWEISEISQEEAIIFLNTINPIGTKENSEYFNNGAFVNLRGRLDINIVKVES